MLNESMYTSTGATSKGMMQKNPHLFEVYHNGYREQVKQWPRNPLDDIIKFLSRQSHKLKVIDLGCGEARLAKEVPQRDIKSFDLVARNESVTACDIAKLPITDGYADVAVFCLSLMGTNYADFLRESYRVLKPKGLLLIAEVASRFPNHNPAVFTNGVEALGFDLIRNHELNKVPENQQMRTVQKGKRKKGSKAPTDCSSDSEIKSTAFFYHFAFKREDQNRPTKTASTECDPLPALRACLYKKR